MLSSFDYTQTTAFFIAFLISLPMKPETEKQQAWPNKQKREERSWNSALSHYPDLARQGMADA